VKCRRLSLTRAYEKRSLKELRERLRALHGTMPPIWGEKRSVA
jgi:hypothetical protein